MEKLKTVGEKLYNEQMYEKNEILLSLLTNYNDGRRKSFFCLVVNLLDLTDIHMVMDQIETAISEETSVKEKAVIAVKCFETMAEDRNIKLKMNKKSRKNT